DRLHPPRSVGCVDLPIRDFLDEHRTLGNYTCLKLVLTDLPRNRGQTCSEDKFPVPGKVLARNHRRCKQSEPKRNYGLSDEIHFSVSLKRLLVQYAATLTAGSQQRQSLLLESFVLQPERDLAEKRLSSSHSGPRRRTASN